MSARTLMVQGTASSAGKSLLVTALCRIFHRQGIRVAPFKSQNMSLNSHVTQEGHEMGRAQAVQAEAAGLAPSSLMNPILLKPSSDRKSQIIINGVVSGVMDAKEYYERRGAFRSAVRASFDALRAAHDLIILEGAGSPAEINLRENDLANMGMAAMAKAPVILVADIDRGGVFASLYGTVKLLEPAEQERIKGFVINKFRGERSILEPGLAQLKALLARPVLGVLPYMDIHIDEEDSLAERLNPTQHTGPDASQRLDIAVIRLPRLSNFTDFAPLDIQPDVDLRYVHSARALGRPDMIILPGTKSTMADLDFLQQNGLAEALRALHAEGTPVFGICGGYQMLGAFLHDARGVESAVPRMDGLALLPLSTDFTERKTTLKTRMTVTAGHGLFSDAQGLHVEGYEIHMGRTTPQEPVEGLGVLGETREGAVSRDGWTAGTYVHGIFDNLAFTRTVLNNLRARRGLAPLPVTRGGYNSFRQTEYDRLADMVESCLDMRELRRIIEAGQ